MACIMLNLEIDVLMLSVHFEMLKVYCQQNTESPVKLYNYTIISSTNLAASGFRGVIRRDCFRIAKKESNEDPFLMWPYDAIKAR